jgi:hypothetical protein
MSNSYLGYRPRSSDIQDGTERHVWGELTYEDAGAIIKVKGTDTEDQEAAVLNISGVGFKLKKDSDSEVFLLASSSDTMLKQAVLTIPKDKQRRWPEGEGGIQHPTDADFSLHFSDKLAHLTKNKFAVGEKGEFEIKGSQGVFRVSKLIVDGELVVNKQIKTPNIVKGSESPPGFEGNKQEAKKSGGGGGGGSQPTQTELFPESDQQIIERLLTENQRLKAENAQLRGLL